MDENTLKLRVELIRDNVIVGTADLKLDNNSNDFKMTSSSSIYDFPTASIECFNPEINKLLLGYSKLDHIRLSISNDKDQNYKTIFEGVFHKKEINFEKDKKLVMLNIQAIHSFYMLSMLRSASVQEFNGITFKEFVHRLVVIANIKSNVQIEGDLADSPIRGISRKTNAFRLFKEICLIKNAIVSFNTDNSVSIKLRPEKLKEMTSKPPITITKEDIISSTRSEEI